MVEVVRTVFELALKNYGLLLLDLELAFEYSKLIFETVASFLLLLE